MTMIIKKHKVTGEIVKVEANAKLPRDLNGVIPHGIFVKVQEATAAATEYTVIGQEVDGVEVVAVKPIQATSTLGYRASMRKTFAQCAVREDATARAMNFERD